MGYLVFAVFSQFSSSAQEAGVSASELGRFRVLAGLSVAFIYFLSVALHEAVHLVFAYFQNALIRSVNLTMLGGLSAIHSLSHSSSSEMKRAGAGILFSAVLGVVSGLVHASAENPWVIFLSYWGAAINLGLAAVNLLPAFPLDVGRGMRAVLIRTQGEIRSTRILVKSSRIAAYLLGFTGVLTFNVPLLLVAFFLYHVATTELVALLTRGVLDGFRTGDVTVPLDPVQESMNIQDAAERMFTSQASILPVLNSDSRPALVTLARIRKVPERYWPVTLVKDVMVSVPIFLEIDQPLSSVIAQLSETHVDAFPIRQKGRLIGLVHVADVEDLLKLGILRQVPPTPIRRQNVA